MSSRRGSQRNSQSSSSQRGTMLIAWMEENQEYLRGR